MNAGDIVGLLGNPGKHAWIIFSLLCLNYFPVAFNHLAMAIYGAQTAHQCRLPVTVVRNNDSVPLTATGSQFDVCKVYVNFSAATGQTIDCPLGYDFMLKDGESTIINEWDLVCGDKYLPNLSTSIYFAGVMVGGVLFGHLSDRLGRQPIMILCLFGPVLLGVMLFLVQGFALFVLIRFLIGIFMQGLQTASYVLAMELFTTSKYRAWTAALFETCWALGVMALAAIAYLCRQWRWIQLTISLASILSLIYIWAIPESLRWLVTGGRVEKAVATLQRSARINKVQLPDNIEAKVQSAVGGTSGAKPKPWDSLRTPYLRRNTLVMYYVWFATALVYYGLSLQASRFTGDKYLNFFISGAVEFPAYLSGVWIISKGGRRIPLAVYFFIGGVACVVAGVIPKETAGGDDIRWISTVLAWVGKFSTAGCWSVIFLYASEIYPTPIRNVSVGACAFWARVGSLLAPQINTIGLYAETWIPMVIFGGAAILGGLLTLLLPETRDQQLPDTLTEAAALGRGKLVVGVLRASDLEVSPTSPHTHGNGKISEAEAPVHNDDLGAADGETVGRAVTAL